MNRILYLNVNNISVMITCTKKLSDIFSENELLLSSVIPMAKLISSSERQEHDYAITIKTGEVPSLMIEKDRLLYSDNGNCFDISSFAYTILTPVVSTLLLRNDQLFIHGAAIDNDGKGFLLIGNGKTSTAFNLCKDYGYKLVAEDNSILNLLNNELLSSCRTINIDSRLAMNPLNNKSRIAPDELGVFIKNTTKIDKIFFLTSSYDRPEVSELTGYEKSSIICTMVNERLLNTSRWNNRLNQQPPILLNRNDLEKKDKIIQNLNDGIPVYKVASIISNNHKIIQEYLQL
jgi:hypothetical protein